MNKAQRKFKKVIKNRERRKRKLLDVQSTKRMMAKTARRRAERESKKHGVV